MNLSVLVGLTQIIPKFHNIDTIVIHPKNKEQLAAIKAFPGALKMEFEITQLTQALTTLNLSSKF